MKLSRIACAAACAALCGPALAADAAKNYPARPIRLIMPIGPGSSNDTLGRIVANKMSDLLKQQVVVDNRAGAGGLLGMEIASKATPDGYTLVAGSAAAMTIVPHLHRKIPYDPVNGFEHIGQYAITPNVLICNVSLPVRSVRDLIEYANARNGHINMASAGVGSQSHLTGVMFMTAAHMKSLHVPYKGGGGTIAVRANEAQWQLPPAASVMGLIRSRQVRALGHTLPHRSPLFPDIPPIAQTLPGFSFNGWNGLEAPRGTPAPIVRNLHEVLVATMNSPEVKSEFQAQATEIHLATGPEFRGFIRSELEKNGELVKLAGLTPAD
jgi:tripartite-type tricarboxylate transporter receptor subunit TctC